MSSGTGRIGTVETEGSDLGLHRSELPGHNGQSNWAPSPFQGLPVLCYHTLLVLGCECPGAEVKSTKEVVIGS